MNQRDWLSRHFGHCCRYSWCVTAVCQKDLVLLLCQRLRLTPLFANKAISTRFILWLAKACSIILNGPLELEMIRGSRESFYWFPSQNTPSFFCLVSHGTIKVSCVWSLSLIKPRCPSTHFIVAAFWEMVPPPHVPVGCVRAGEGDGRVSSSHTSPPWEGDRGKQPLAVREAALSPAWLSLCYGSSGAPGGGPPVSMLWKTGRGKRKSVGHNQ